MGQKATKASLGRFLREEFDLSRDKTIEVAEGLLEAYEISAVSVTELPGRTTPEIDQHWLDGAGNRVVVTDLDKGPFLGPDPTTPWVVTRIHWASIEHPEVRGVTPIEDWEKMCSPVQS